MTPPPLLWLLLHLAMEPLTVGGLSPLLLLLLLLLAMTTAMVVAGVRASALTVQQQERQRSLPTPVVTTSPPHPRPLLLLRVDALRTPLRPLATSPRPLPGLALQLQL